MSVNELELLGVAPLSGKHFTLMGKGKPFDLNGARGTIWHYG